MDLFWENEGWEQHDRHLTALREAPFLRPFPQIALKPGLHILRGPRQVGKSSWLKSLLSNCPQPRHAFYLSCETISSFKDLHEILRHIRDKRQFVLLDEISFVSDWARAIKHEIDSGFKGTMVITGSNTFDLRKGMDQMPGRLADGKEMALLPMGFQEFLAMRSQAGWPKLSHVDALRMYFRVGGFPLAVAEAGPNGSNPSRAWEIYQRWLAGDALKLGKQETYLREILSQIALTTGSPLSLQKLAQRTQMGSHHTALEYVSLLESCFALRTCYAIDPNTGAARLRADKKWYFTDPLIYWASLEWAGMPSPVNHEEHLAEIVSHEELARRSEDHKQRVGYYLSRHGEVDFYSYQRWALEVKWAPFPKNLSKAYKNLVVPEKLVWSQQNFLEDFPSRFYTDGQ